MVDFLIIGFDGGDPALLRQWADEGHLPNFKRLMDRGVFGELRTTAMPITPSAWTSFMTGKNPGKHGIFDFTTINDKHNVDVVNFHDMHEDTFFEMLDRHSVGMLNVPATYPPKPLNDGFMVSGMMTPSLDKSCLDEDIVQTLKDLDYRIEVNNTFQGDNEDELLPEMEAVMDKRSEAAAELLQDRDPDVFMATFVTADRASHWFWKHMDEYHPDHRPGDEEYEDTVREFYAKTDDKLGELLDQIDDEIDVIVMSDHGFTGLEKSINLNNLFMQQGYLAVRKNPLSLLRYALFRAGFTLENIYSLVQKLGLGGMVKQVADSPETNTLRQLLSFPFFSFQDIDWENTKAYSALHFGPIFLNCSGEERERLKQQIKNDLEQLEDDGKKIIDEIEFKEDIFSGKNMDQAPDIIYRTKGMKYQSHRYFEFGSNKLFSRTHNTESGHHRMEGVFLAAGPSFSEGELEKAEILDLAPTLLHALGYPVPDDMDGRVMHEAVVEKAQETRSNTEMDV